ncbi:MAG: TlpA family protein disulfide reductase [Candidatus Helarchaeota archaeon]
MVDIDFLEEKIGKKLKGKPTLVDIWAQWCGPCLYLSPYIDEIHKKYEDKLNIVRVNTEEGPGREIFMHYAQPLGVNGIPFILFFDKDGNLKEHVLGAYIEKIQETADKIVSASG